MGTLTMYHFALDKMRTMREMAIANEVVQTQVEMLRAAPFASLEDCENAPFKLGAVSDVSTLVNATPSLSIRASGDPALRLKEVTVLLRWTGDSGRTMKHGVTTLITDKDSKP